MDALATTTRLYDQAIALVERLRVERRKAFGRSAEFARVTTTYRRAESRAIRREMALRAAEDAAFWGGAGTR